MSKIILNGIMVEAVGTIVGELTLKLYKKYCIYCWKKLYIPSKRI